MKYIIRAAKYFLHLAVLLFLFILVLSLLHIVGNNVNEIFRGGTDSLWQIGLLLLVFSAIYPMLGYGKRSVMIPGSYSQIRDGVVRAMEERGYILEKEEGENMTFRLKGTLQRLVRIFEDRITLTRRMSGFEAEGKVKDLVRVISSLEEHFRGE